MTKTFNRFKATIPCSNYIKIKKKCLCFTDVNLYAKKHGSICSVIFKGQNFNFKTNSKRLFTFAEETAPESFYTT